MVFYYGIHDDIEGENDVSKEKLKLYYFATGGIAGAIAWGCNYYICGIFHESHYGKRYRKKSGRYDLCDSDAV